MLTDIQQQTIAGSCTTVLTGVIEAFPAMLTRAEPDRAIEIVADLLKALLAEPNLQHIPTFQEIAKEMNSQ